MNTSVVWCSIGSRILGNRKYAAILPDVEDSYGFPACFSFSRDGAVNGYGRYAFLVPLSKSSAAGTWIVSMTDVGELSDDRLSICLCDLPKGLTKPFTQALEKLIKKIWANMISPRDRLHLTAFNEVKTILRRLRPKVPDRYRPVPDLGYDHVRHIFL